MRTFEGPQGTGFVFNGDMSGLVTVYADRATVHIPGADLLAFAAHIVRTKKIAALESASDDEILEVF